MKHKFIPAEESFREWNKDPKYIAEYKALDKEFVHASALIETRSKPDPPPIETIKLAHTVRVLSCASSISTLVETIARGIGTTAYRPLHLYSDTLTMPQHRPLMQVTVACLKASSLVSK